MAAVCDTCEPPVWLTESCRASEALTVPCTSHRPSAPAAAIAVKWTEPRNISIQGGESD